MYSAEEVLAQYDAMIHKAANKYSFNKNGLTDYEDFVEEGKLAAIKAAQNFDENKGSSFPVYLTFSLNNELRKFAGRNHHELSVSEMEFRKKENKKPELPNVIRDSVIDKSDTFYVNGRTEWTETYLGSIPSGDLNPESLAIQKETLELLRDEINELPERERAVINMRFYEDMTLVQIADLMNSSKQTVSNLEKRGIEQLRKRMASKLGE